MGQAGHTGKFGIWEEEEVFLTWVPFGAMYLGYWELCDPGCNGLDAEAKHCGDENVGLDRTCFGGCEKGGEEGLHMI